MNQIYNNPYRILGVCSNASLKEITANKTKLLRFASVGKTLSFDTDMDCLMPVASRTTVSIEKSFADLSLPQDKIKYALFWFVKDNNIDEMALNYLNAGDISKAEELLFKRETWSSLINLGVISMVKDDWKNAITNISKVIHNNEYKAAFVNACCGDTYSIDESELAKSFIDSLSSFIPVADLYQLFSQFGCNPSEAELLKSNLTDGPKEKLNSEIQKAKSVQDDGVAIYNAGVALQNNAKPLLEQLALLLEPSSLEYKLLVDKYAKAILQCCVDSFNSLQQKIDSGEIEQFREYAPKVKDLLASIDITKISDVVKGRIESNLKTISEIVSNLDDYVLSQSHLCYYCGKHKAVTSAQYTQKMYLETGRKRTATQRQVFYKECTVGIDRCEECKEIHDKGSGGLLAVFLLLCIASFIVVGILLNFIASIFFGWIPGLIIAFIIDSIVNSSKRNKYHIKMEGDIHEHPVIKKLKSEGWSMSKPTA